MARKVLLEKICSFTKRQEEGRGGECKEEEADSAGFLKFFHMLGDL